VRSHHASTSWTRSLIPRRFITRLSGGELPPGLFPVEAYHAEFVIGPQLYVLQADGPPSSTFGAEFDKVVRTVYEAASSS